jgi:hypothetical protein
MRTSSNATRYLQRIGHSWYVRVKVPPKLQDAIGNTHVRKALGTRDLDQANVLKWSHVKAIKAQLAELRAVDPAAREASEFRQQLQREREAGNDDVVEAVENVAVERAE